MTLADIGALAVDYFELSEETRKAAKLSRVKGRRRSLKKTRAALRKLISAVTEYRRNRDAIQESTP